jgi:Dimerisation domain
VQVRGEITWSTTRRSAARWTGAAGFRALHANWSTSPKLFEFMGGGPHCVDEIATALGVARRPVEALLNTCVAIGLVAVCGGRYALTPMAEAYLLDTSPTYIGGYLELLIAGYSNDFFRSMEKGIRTNTSQVYRGESIFDARKEEIEMA